MLSIGLLPIENLLSVLDPLETVSEINQYKKPKRDDQISILMNQRMVLRFQRDTLELDTMSKNATC